MMSRTMQMLANAMRVIAASAKFAAAFRRLTPMSDEGAAPAMISNTLMETAFAATRNRQASSVREERSAAGHGEVAIRPGF